MFSDTGIIFSNPLVTEEMINDMLAKTLSTTLQTIKNVLTGIFNAYAT
jgi:hypothetical protein